VASRCFQFSIVWPVLFSLTSLLSAQMLVENLRGPATKGETDSFLSFISSAQPAASNENNAWSYGPSGQMIRAAGLVYQINRDTRVLDRMLFFCDSMLSERNDLALAPVGQHIIWTGRVDPAWPNVLAKDPLSTGGEQGDPVGHLGNCAVTVLQAPALWQKTVPDGDPHRFGSTYLARAKYYVKQADDAVDGHILNGLLDLSHNDHQYFSAKSPYKGGTPVPWNQQMMFNYAFQELATAHSLLKDDPARVAQYRKIVTDSMEWFFTEAVQISTDRQGRQVYNWGYAMPDKHGEDATHASMDIAGFYLAYLDGGYGVDREKMTRFADTFLDVMTLAPGNFAGRVDGTSGAGHGSPTTTIRGGYLFLAEFRPQAYFDMANTQFKEGQQISNPELFSRWLWVKSRLVKTEQSLSATNK